ADPRIVPQARRLETIAYDEMLELAALGAQVMHSRSIELASHYNVVVHVRSSFNDTKGTLIVRETPQMEKIVVRGAAIKRALDRIPRLGAPLSAGLAASVFARISEAGLVVDDIIQNVQHGDGTTNISFTIAADDIREARSLAADLSKSLGFRAVEIDQEVSK